MLVEGMQEHWMKINAGNVTVMKLNDTEHEGYGIGKENTTD